MSDGPRLITGGEDDALLPHLIDQLATADQAGRSTWCRSLRRLALSV
jgi:hypothetical protein